MVRLPTLQGWKIYGSKKQILSKLFQRYLNIFMVLKKFPSWNLTEIFKLIVQIRTVSDPDPDNVGKLQNKSGCYNQWT